MIRVINESKDEDAIRYLQSGLEYIKNAESVDDLEFLCDDPKMSWFFYETDRLIDNGLSFEQAKKEMIITIEEEIQWHKDFGYDKRGVF